MQLRNESKDHEVKPNESSPLRTWGDLIIVFIVLLLSETARGIVLPTLAPYVDLIGGDTSMLGYAVAAFSVGRFVSTIGLGYLSTTLSYKKVLGGSVAICVVGNLMYSFAYFFGPYFMLGSRFITGFGAGTLSVIRAYVAHVTTPQERTSYMSILGAVQFFGFAIMPGAGSLLTYVPRFYINGAPFDKFTLPGYVLAILNLLLLLLLLFEFKNPPPLVTQIDSSKSRPNSPLSNHRSPPLGEPPVPPTPIPPAPPSPYLRTSLYPLSPAPIQSSHSSIIVSPQFQHPYNLQYPPQFPSHFSPQFIPRSPHSPVTEILNSPHIMPSPHSPYLHSPRLSDSPYKPPSSPHYGHTLESPHSPSSHPPSSPTTRIPPPSSDTLTNKQKILIFGVFLILNLMVRLVLGIIETISTPVYIDLNDGKPGKDVEAGFVFGGLGLIGMGVLFLISYLSKRKVKDFTILICGLSTLVIGSGLLIGNLDLPRFIIGCGFIWCIGYPLAQTIIVSMFSKMLGNKPQGTWMGWIGAMGSLGRIIGPSIAGVLLDNVGQSETFIFGTAVAAVSLLTSLLLIPVKDKKPPQ